MYSLENSYACNTTLIYNITDFRGKSSEITVSKAENEHINAPPSPSELSTAALDDLNSSTSAPGLDSLGRYLTSPLSEEPVAAAILESTALRDTGIEARTDLFLDSHDVLIANNARETFTAKKDDWKRRAQEKLQLARDRFDQIDSYPPRAGSMSYNFQDSDSSAGSAHSFSSVDSRGSRRGRKRWRQGGPPTNPASLHLPEIGSAVSSLHLILTNTNFTTGICKYNSYGSNSQLPHALHVAWLRITISIQIRVGTA